MIIVDQMRAPVWFQTSGAAAALMPNLRALRNGGVSFASHYTAANDCTPSRAALLTGLYSHQTGCLVTGGSTLDPKFQTWGTMLRDLGYTTAWFGKWHLTRHDNLWSVAHNAGALERYGFAGGTYPSPDGAPGEGSRVDPVIAAQFKSWYAKAPANRPWCATVSLVNPHDIAWWYLWSRQVASERQAPSLVHTLPPNFETPAQLIARRKPRLQLSLQQTADSGFGAVPFSGSKAVRAWLPFLDLYLKLLGAVDRQIGAITATLSSRPHLAANTVILFTSDHGEYGASHGLRGKGGGVYDEAIRVPLIVKDHRGRLNAAPSHERTGLTSSVDVTPMLLTIATGSNAWRKDAHFDHLADRHDIGPMLTDPRAPGRQLIVHATDEIVSEFATEPYAADAPLHVVAVRSAKAKYAVYSNWKASTNSMQSAGQEHELYDYSTQSGRMELDNSAGSSHLQQELDATLTSAIRHELRAQLPARLHAAQTAGYLDYYGTAESAVLDFAQKRLQIEEHESPSKAAQSLGDQ